MKELYHDAVFMICFAQGQDHLIARREIDFTYCPTLCKSYLKTSSCTPNQLRRLMRHGKNQDFSFSYNGALIENWIVDFNEMAPSVAQIIVADKFPGYEDEDMQEGHSPERVVAASKPSIGVTYVGLENYLEKEVEKAQARLNWLKSKWEWKPIPANLTAEQMCIYMKQRPSKEAIDAYMSEAVQAQEILSYLNNQLYLYRRRNG